MRLILSILLINLIFVANNAIFGEDIDESEDIILTDKEMREYAKSFDRLEKYYRYLQQDYSTSEESESEEPGESESESESEPEPESSSSEAEPSANATVTDTEQEESSSSEVESSTNPVETEPETSAESSTNPVVTEPETSGQDTSRQEPPATQSPPPVPEQTTPPPPSTNREAAIHVLYYNNFNLEPQPTEPSRPTVTMITITFNLHVYYYGYSPFRYITMTLKITTVILRGLQEGERVDKNATTLCEYNSFDNENHICLYDCNAETDVQPTAVQSYNDFKFKVSANAEPIEIKDSNGDLSISLSPDAQFASLTLMNQTSTVNKFVTLNNGYVFSNDSSIFYVRGKLVGQNSDRVVNKDQVTFTFYDKTSTGAGDNQRGVPVNVTCLVTNHDVENFELKCEPKGNLTTNLYESSAIIDDDILLSLNMTEQDYVNIVKYGPTNRAGNNLFYHKSSSGLSGGAIAGIVIACAVVLIIITVIAMFLRRHKATDVGNSTIVGLKSVDNYTE